MGVGGGPVAFCDVCRMIKLVMSFLKLLALETDLSPFGGMPALKPVNERGDQ